MTPDRGVAGMLLVLPLCSLTGCGTEPGTVATERAAPPSALAPGFLVGCGGGSGWSPSVMSEGVSSAFTGEARSTFEALLAEPGLGEELGLSFLVDGPDTAFRVLRDDGDTVTLGLGRWTDEAGPVDGARVMSLTREGDGWDVDSGGDCGLEPVLQDGARWVELVGPVSSTDDGRTLELGVSERDCTSARDPLPHLREPVVVETADTVTVSWTSTAMEEAATCPGNPVVPRSVTLDEPLGDRTVLDGSVWPPRPLAAATQ